MRVLIGFEESGVVRRAFRKRGHDAWSCDLEPARDDSEHHYLCDIYKAMDDGPWDLLIFHPMCTALTVAGNSTYAKGKAKYNLRLEAISYTKNLWNDAIAICDKVCFENPVSVIFPYLRKLGAHVQYIHPWQFSHPEQKRTGLALHGLKPLIETSNVYEYMMTLPKKDRERKHYMSPSPNRARDRSETYQGIGEAMAEQWG